MQILVLGGTRFAGRAIVEAALGRGDTVTLFNRGQLNPGLFPGVETVTGDRTKDLSPLDGREFDAVIDVACYEPGTARLSAEAFGGRTGRYVFVSTVSVYASQATTEAQLEDAPVAALKPDVTDFAENYGANKALCEDIIRDVYGDRALIGRPGLIDSSPAVGAGLSCRTITETIRDTLAWDLGRGGPEHPGLDPAEEQRLLAGFAG